MSFRPRLLLVDDEERILRSLSLLFRPAYDVVATVDALEALQRVRTDRFDVIVSDQRMPAMRGAELLRQVRDLSPNTMRILLTGYSELEAVVASVNDGEVFRFINKPWDSAQLKATVAEATRIARGLFEAAPGPAIGLSVTAPTPAGIMPSAAGPAVLVLDDDPAVVEDVRGAFPTGPVLAAGSLDQAFALLAEHEVGVVISELQVGRESATLALKMLKAQHPEVVTIVLTPFQDTNVLIDLINQGQVYRFLPKPVRRGPLGMNIGSALRHHRALKAAPALRAAQSVQAVIPAAADQGLATRLGRYLSRLRRGELTLT